MINYLKITTNLNPGNHNDIIKIKNLVNCMSQTSKIQLQGE